MALNKQLAMVNTVLIEIGESAVNSLTDSRIVRNVIKVLDRQKQTILSNKGQGYSFNRYENFKAIKDSNGHFMVPEGTMYALTADNNAISIRDGRLFDVANNSFLDISFTDIILIMDLDYNDLDPLLDDYITFSAVYRYKKIHAFAQTEINEANLTQILARDTINENEIYKVQQDSSFNHFNNTNTYTAETSANNRKRI